MSTKAPLPSLQPISTAPRDGTPVYLYWPCCPAMPLASWQVCRGGNDDGTGWIFMWALEDETVKIGQVDEGWLGYEGDPVPTHWLPAGESYEQD